MMQLSIFNLGCEKPYKIKKPIRLIELFGGIGSQAKALRNLGANFEHYRICEFDKYAVQSYNEIHGTSFTTSDITKITAADLGIVETNKYEYIMTYSFPCQDLSIAGKQAGMEKGSGTRSGLLWEVERLLEECEELPQILLMENVPQVHGKKNKKSFYKWIEKLESLGYRNYWQDLNAKNYGIPQNRNRTFMVSLLGDYFYEFPQSIPLKLRLKDMLEDEVDEKYYLSENMLKYINSYDKKYKVNDNRLLLNREIASLISTRTGQNRADCSDYISNVLPDNFNIAGKDLTCPSITTSCWESNSLLKKPIIVDDIYNNREPREYRDTAPTLRIGGGRLKVVENYRIRKLTPKECWRLMGFSDKDFYAAQSAGVSNSQLYKQAGNSIVVNVLEEIFKKLF